MAGFQSKPNIIEYDKITQFRDEFNINKEDVIFTEKFLYENFMKGVFDCQYIFLDDYGLGEPSDVVIDKILKDIYGKKIDRIIGIGGGSSR